MPRQKAQRGQRPKGKKQSGLTRKHKPVGATEAQRVRDMGTQTAEQGTRGGPRRVAYQAEGWDFVLKVLGSHWRTLSREEAGAGAGRPLRLGGFSLEGRGGALGRLGQGSRWEKMRPELWGPEDGEEELGEGGGEGRRDRAGS